MKRLSIVCLALAMTVFLTFGTALAVTNYPPVADPNGPYLGVAGSPITFDGTGSFDPDGDTLTYHWDCGDGSTETGSAPSHTYTDAGIYNVCLTVNDGTVDSEEVCTYAEVPVIVPLDIKPGSCPNPLNLKSKGVLPVAVLGTLDLDVTTIDPLTILLSREGIEEGVAPIRSNYEDVATPFEGELCDCHDLNGDGYADLTLKFKTQELVEILELAEVAGETIPLTLTGCLHDNDSDIPIIGADCIWVLEKR